MEKRYFIIGIALVLLLAGTVGAAEVKTKTKPVSCTFAASAADGVETHIDTNGDGQSALLAQGINNCSFGKFFIQVETEYTSPVTPNTTCPTGTEELHLVQNHSVWTEENTADQLFGEATSISLCLNATSADLPFSYTAKAILAGGTGRFAGATGSLDLQGSGKYLGDF